MVPFSDRGGRHKKSPKYSKEHYNLQTSFGNTFLGQLCQVNHDKKICLFLEMVDLKEPLLIRFSRTVAYVNHLYKWVISMSGFIKSTVHRNRFQGRLTKSSVLKKIAP